VLMGAAVHHIPDAGSLVVPAVHHTPLVYESMTAAMELHIPDSGSLAVPTVHNTQALRSLPKIKLWVRH
jgi:hypothetical protein